MDRWELYSSNQTLWYLWIKKILVQIIVENNSCSRFISHEITVMWSIIKFLSCNISIDDVDSRTPYFYGVLLMYYSIPEEVRNITIQPILSSTVDTYGILIGKAPKFFLVVEKVGGHNRPAFQIQRRVTQGDPLSPTIFNVVVDSIIRHWVTVVGES